MPAHQNKNFLNFLEKISNYESSLTGTGVNIWITRINEKPFFNDIKEIEISYEEWSNITDVYDIISELKEEFKQLKRLKIKITKGWSFTESDSDDDNLSVISTRTEDPCQV